jgi:hypothetical protein
MPRISLRGVAIPAGAGGKGPGIPSGCPGSMSSKSGYQAAEVNSG